MLSSEIQYKIQLSSMLLFQSTSNLLLVNFQSTSSSLPFLVNANSSSLSVLVKFTSSSLPDLTKSTSSYFPVLFQSSLTISSLCYLAKLQRNLYQWFFCFFYSDMMRWKTSHAFLNSLFPSIYLDRIPAFDVAV